MIPLFTEVPSGGQTVSFHPQTDYVMRGVKQNVQLAVNYWRRNYFAARKPNQFLIQLLQTLDVDLNMSLANYYSCVDAKALSFSQVLGMTSSLAKGRAHKDHFYATPTVEYFLADDSPLNPNEVHDQWESVAAVQVLMHPKSDLHCVLPTAAPYSGEAGLAVIKVHIPALAVQYRAFRLSQQGNALGEENTQMFIERYVLPNMLFSQTEVALFNRLVRVVGEQGTQVSTSSLAHSPFQLPFPDGKVDNVLYATMENYANVDPVWEKLLRNTPAIYAVDALEAFQLPKVAMTGNVEWLLVACRLKLFDFVCKLAGNRLLRANQLEVSQLLRVFRDPDVASQLDRLPFGADEIGHYVDNVLLAAKRQDY